ncbi:Uncharacterised protein [Serratia marcescens]|uniref:hypothetical protein n=1 Tax=Serratia marcescens TaxID=615 RepID=UPI001EF6F1AF|nr:hypothetical protein [Serratia marcescens]CAB5683242.1 Uncharacterised protein [Serratia marcescens]CAB5698518.1 Uncharacterised protein [Serratia marcescens]
MKRIIAVFSFLLISGCVPASGKFTVGDMKLDFQHEYDSDDNWNQLFYKKNRQLTKEPKRQIRKSMVEKQLKSRGRMDNSTDSGEGFGLPARY